MFQEVIMRFEMVESISCDKMIAEINRRVKEMWKRDGELHMPVVANGNVYA
jgi:hypothetical protein